MTSPAPDSPISSTDWANETPSTSIAPPITNLVVSTSSTTSTAQLRQSVETPSSATRHPAAPPSGVTIDRPISRRRHRSVATTPATVAPTNTIPGPTAWTPSPAMIGPTKKARPSPSEDRELAATSSSGPPARRGRTA